MAEITDYLAKRAASNTISNEVFAGLGLVDTEVVVLSAGIKGLLEQIPVEKSVYNIKVNMRTAKGSLWSGVINVVKEYDGDGNPTGDFVAGVTSGILGGKVAGFFFGNSVNQALARLLGQVSIATGATFSALALAEGAVASVAGSALITFAKQGYATLCTREFSATYDQDENVYRIETNWNLQDNLYGNLFSNLWYLSDKFTGNPRDLRTIMEQVDSEGNPCNGFDLVGENPDGLAYLKFRKNDTGSGLTNVFRYGGDLGLAKTPTQLEKTSDIDAMADFLENENFNLITVDSGGNEQSHNVTSFKFIDGFEKLHGLAKGNDKILTSVMLLQKFYVTNDYTISDTDIEKTLEVCEGFSAQMFRHRVEMAMAYAGGTPLGNLIKRDYKDISGLNIFATNSTDPEVEELPFGSWVAFGGGNNIVLQGGDLNDYLYGAVVPYLPNYDDVIYGLGGNDYIEGGNGADTMHGGLGNDTFFIMGEDEAYDTFNGGADTDTILGSDGDDTIRVHNLDSSNSIEKIDGGEGTNKLAGTVLDDVIDLTGTTVERIDHIEGGDGNDTITGTSGDDTLYGGEDSDTLKGMAGNDILYGTKDDGSDDHAPDRLEGGVGNDTYHIGAGDTVFDSDKQATIWFGEQQLSSLSLTQIYSDLDYYQSDDLSYRAIFDGETNRLSIKYNSLSAFHIENFTSGDYGITLEEYVPEDTGHTYIGTDSVEGGMLHDVYGTDTNKYQIVTGPYSIDQDTKSITWDIDNSTILWTVDVSGGVPDLSISGGGGGDYLWGLSGNDQLYGDDGDDQLIGFGGDDILDGGLGIDHLYGNDGDDVLVGGDDGDYLFGDNHDGTGDGGNDYLIGGLGDDQLIGNSGVDVIDGGEGNDLLWGDTEGIAGGGDDILFGGSGTDQLVGNAGNDILDGGEDNDNIYGDDRIDFSISGADIIYGGGGNDQIAGNGGNDLIYGEDGNDYITGDNSPNGGGAEGDDSIWGGIGDDTLVGNGGRDTLYGGDGVDRLFGDNQDGSGIGANDILHGEAGRDYIYGNSGDDKLYGGNDDDYLYGDNQDGSGTGSDELYGEAGNDQLLGYGGNDVLSGGDGDDLITGDNSDINDTGDDILYGDAGNDTLYGDNSDGSGVTGNDQLFGGTGIDQLIGNSGDDILHGGADNDLLWGDNHDDTGTGGNDELYGDTGDDQLIGNGGDDLLDGGAGDDTLYGDNPSENTTSGVDTLIGGTGRDYLAGGMGDDVYRFSQGDGEDIVVDTDGSNSVYIEGVSSSDSVTVLSVTIVNENDSNNVYYQNGSDLLIYYGEQDAVAIQGGMLSQNFTYNIGGTVLTASDIISKAVNPGFPTGGNLDIADGSSSFLTGGTEDNIFVTDSATTTLQGGDGDDFYIFNGGFGDDTITETEGIDQVIFHSSGIVNSDGTVFSEYTTNRLEPVLQQSDADAGLTSQAISLSGIHLYRHLDQTAAQSSIGQPVLFDEISVNRGLIDEYSLTITHGTNNLNISNWYNPNTSTTIEYFEFADGTVVSSNMLESKQEVAAATENSDLIYGGQNADTISGLGGVNTIYGYLGDDVLIGGDDVDYLYGEQDDDTLSGGAGSDILSGGSGNDTLSGGTGDDTLIGGTGDNIFSGGTGDDIINADTGNNTFYFNLGDGSDTLTLSDTGINSLVLGAGILASDISVSAGSGGSVAITIANTSDQITITNWSNTSGDYSLDSIEFDNGEIWSSSYLTEIIKIPTEILEVGDLMDSGGFTRDAWDHLTRYGFDVALDGDINGDGFDDIIIGSNKRRYYTYDWDYGFTGELTKGYATLIFGDSAGSSKVSGSIDGGALGYRVSTAGDINGDGIHDLLLLEPSGQTSSALHVLLGSTTELQQNISLDTSGSYEVFTSTSHIDERYTDDSDFLGDINGDGLDDIIINSDTNASEKRSYIVMGQDSNSISTTALSFLGPNGGDVTENLGVEKAGDINGDGYDDLLLSVIGGDNQGTYIYYGKEGSTYSLFDLSANDGIAGFKISDSYNVKIEASHGDINGDNLDDLVLNSGKIVFGKSDQFAASFDLANLNGINGFSLTDIANTAISSAGDVNGDGINDLLINNTGNSIYLLFGKTTGFTSDINLDYLTSSEGFIIDASNYPMGTEYNTPRSLDNFGFSISTGGDINGDGFDDIVIGAPDSSTGGYYTSYDSTGMAFVVYGRDFNQEVDYLGQDANDTIIGDAGNNILIGGSGNDYLDGGNGDDVLKGASGNDVLVYDSNDTFRIDGGNGHDVLKVNNVGDDLDLTNLNINDHYNRITGIEGIDLSIAGSNDLILSSLGLRHLSGTSNSLRVTGSDDDIVSLDFNEWLEDDQVIHNNHEYDVYKNGVLTLEIQSEIGRIVTGDGYNSVTGTIGDDTLAGTDGADHLIGDSGNDTLQSSRGVDILDGGAGIDIVDYSNSHAAVNIDLSSGKVGGGTATGDSLSSIENISGSLFGDYLRGNGDTNILFGEAGDDILNGGLGHDILEGGLGADTFLFDTDLDSGSNKDTILDFNKSEDTIALDKSIFSAFETEGAITRKNFVTTNKGVARKDSHYLIYNSKTGSLLYDADANGPGVAVEFAVLDNKSRLSSDNFVISA